MKNRWTFRIFGAILALCGLSIELYAETSKDLQPKQVTACVSAGCVQLSEEETHKLQQYANALGSDSDFNFGPENAKRANTRLMLRIAAAFVAIGAITFLALGARERASQKH